MDRVGIGIIGCGNISAAYLKASRKFPVLDIRAVADRDMDAARARAEEFGVRASTPAELLADTSVEIVVNLTTPEAHVPVSMQVLEAGKHVHSEKPLGITVDQARPLVRAAEARGLRLGCAPDTFLGGSHQTCRKLIDEGAIGRPVAGTAFFMCAGHERWHPNPAFYYQTGGGPMLDMGPYYVTALVNLLGPVASVTALASKARAERTITSEPRQGERIPVEVATHVTGVVEFVGGAVVTMAMSFDVPRHRHGPIELYGTEGAMVVPDPNHFGGDIEVATAAEDWRTMPTEHAHADDNYRIIGVADMAHAIREGRPHRAGGALAYHVLEVMEAFQVSSDEGARIAIETRPERPAPLAAGAATGEIA